MSDAPTRTGEKVGWTAGWIGAFVWVLVLSLVFLGQGDTAHGLAGITLTLVAAGLIVLLAPWRFPATRYWKLMLAPLGAFVLSLLWAAWAFGGLDGSGLAWWNVAWLLPLSIPMLILGRKRWIDG